MADYNSAANISAFVNTIWEAAVLAARDADFMTSLVYNPSPTSTIATRTRSDYGTVAYQTIGDTEDLVSQAMTPTAGASLTPSLYAAQFFLPDRRVRTDPFGIQSDASNELGKGAAKHVHKNLIGTFSSLTGGTVGSAGGTLTWSDLFEGVVRLRQQNAPEPYFGVLQPGQWFHIGTAIIPAGAATNAPDWVADMKSQYFLGSFFGVNWFMSNDITTGTAATGGVFSRDAMAYDERKGFSIEPQRDASRGGGGWELNASMDYAYGVWRPLFGVQVIATSVLPT